VLRGITAGVDPILDYNKLDYGVYNFAGTTPTELDEIILGKRPVSAEDSWFREPPPPADRGDATHTAQGDALSLAEWGRIYGRIWMDKFINDPAHPEFIPFQPKYPFKDYVKKFEIDPAAVVAVIVPELNGLPDSKPPISYIPGTTRLYPLANQPAGWSPAELNSIINSGTTTGTPSGQSLRWIMRKCC
jgi:hypothetical protein